jgi:hypothetical protein
MSNFNQQLALQLSIARKNLKGNFFVRNITEQERESPKKYSTVVDIKERVVFQKCGNLIS